MKSLIFRMIVTTLLTLISINTAAMTSQFLPSSFKAVGSGQLTWFGLDIYEATLYAPAGKYSPQSAYALQIDYRRKFTRSQLAKTSLKEIERIFGDQADDEAIILNLEAVFRDVRSGDHILGLYHPDQGAEFYSDGKLLGRLEDTALAQAFFAIWLNPRTSAPDLRRQLLGLTQ